MQAAPRNFAQILAIVTIGAYEVIIELDGLLNCLPTSAAHV